jgi:GT2 family glycosyltransferase/glycosyltransferase involved in cell wall biosynthesis
LCVSDSPFVHTGFANQMRKIATHFGEMGHKVSYLAWFTNGFRNAKAYIPTKYTTYSTTLSYANCPGCHYKTPILERVDPDGELTRFEIRENKVVPSTNRCSSFETAMCVPEDKYGMTSFPWVVDTVKPDIVLTIGDIWMVESYTRGIFRKHYSLVCYMPVDGAPWPTMTRQSSGQLQNYGGYEIGWKQTLHNIDRVVGYTDFAKNTINELMEDEKCKDVIWHGCDRKILYPMNQDERDAARLEFFQRKGIGLIDGSFASVGVDDILVTCVSRNQPRKGYPILFEAISKYRQQTDKKVWLYCHASLRDWGWNFDDLAKRYGIEDCVALNHGMSVGLGNEDEDMRNIYNMSTFTALLSRGEGWGLSVSESMACGIPVVSSPYSGHGSDGGWAIGAFEPVKIKAMDTEPVTGIDRAICDVDDTVAAFHRAMKPERYAELVKLGLERAEEFSWENVLPKWDNIIGTTPLKPYKYPVRRDVAQQQQSIAVPTAWETNPKVSIVIPSSIILQMKNYDQILRQCITALDQITYRPFEIIIIDNGSHGKDMAEYLSKIRHTVLRWPFKYKPSKVLNKAVCGITGDYTLFLHNDTMIESNALSRMMNAFAMRDRVGAVGPALVSQDRKDKTYGLDFDHSLEMNPVTKSQGNVMEVSAVSDACLLIPTPLFTQMSGFDEEFTMDYHDWDLCLRLKREGYSILVDTSAECIHYGGLTRKYIQKSVRIMDERKFYERHGYKNRKAA